MLPWPRARCTSTLPPGYLAAWASVLALFLMLAATGIRSGLPNEVSWSNDDISPNGPLKAPNEYISGTSKYPYLQPLIDRALYQPYLIRARAEGSLDAGCAPIRGDCFQDPPAALGHLMLISRLRSLVMAAGAVVATGLLAGMLFGPQAAVAAGLLAAVNETLGFFGKLGNLDAPYTMWFMLSMLAYVRVLQRGSRRAWTAFGLLSGLTLATKEGIGGASVLTGLLMLLAEGSRVRRAAERRVALREAFLRLGLMALGLFGVYGLVQNALFNWPGFVDHLQHWVGVVSVDNTNHAYTGPLWVLGQLRLRAVEGAGWPLLLFLVAGSVYLLMGSGSEAAEHRRSALWLITPVLSFILFTLLPIHFVYSRFLLPSYLLLAAAAAPLALRLWQAGWPVKGGPARGRLVVGAVLVYSALYSLNVGLAMRVDTRLAAEDWLRENLPPDAGVAAFGDPTYFPRIDALVEDWDTEFVRWKGMPPFHSAPPTGDGFPSEWAEALALMLQSADIPKRNVPPGAPDWLLLSSRCEPPEGTAGARLWERLKAGDAGYKLIWDTDQAFPGMPRHDHRPSPLGRWLPGATVEFRVSPRIWVLARDG